MTIRITKEQAVKNQCTHYLVDVFNENGQIISSRKIRPHIYRSSSGKLLLYNSHDELIQDAIPFLNRNAAPNTLQHNGSDLCQLLAACEVFNLDYRSIDNLEVKKIQNFLLGRTNNTDKIEFVGFSQIKTVSFERVCSTIHSYLKSLNLASASLFSKKNLVSSYHGQSLISISPIPAEKFLTEEEFISLLQSAIEVFDDEEIRLRAYCIISIMYTTGLRIGEILGLTQEDVCLKPIEGTDQSGNHFTDSATVFIVRNRLSDSLRQCGKMLIHPQSPSDYNSTEYKTETTGFTYAYGPAKLCELIAKYIDLAHTRAQRKNKKNYINHIHADSITASDNSYIFIDRHRINRLEPSYWNKQIRQIFIHAGIPVDKEVRTIGLNHRFRHGYCMYIRNNFPFSEAELMKLSRHRSVKAFRVYAGPTSEEIANILLSIPELLKSFPMEEML